MQSLYIFLCAFYDNYYVYLCAFIPMRKFLYVVNVNSHDAFFIVENYYKLSKQVYMGMGKILWACPKPQQKTLIQAN